MFHPIDKDMSQKLAKEFPNWCCAGNCEGGQEDCMVTNL